VPALSHALARAEESDTSEKSLGADKLFLLDNKFDLGSFSRFHVSEQGVDE